MEGCATFYKRSRFRLVEKHVIEFDEEKEESDVAWGGERKIFIDTYVAHYRYDSPY